MTKPKRKPLSQFHTFLVQPEPGFEPTNWRQNPSHYRIVEYVGPQMLKGSADAWKFLHNHEAIEKGETRHWAIYLDFDQSIFPTRPAIQPPRLERQNLASQCETAARKKFSNRAFLAEA